MSEYSGRCDVCDHFHIRADSNEDIQKEIDRTDFYIWGENGRRFKLDIHTIKDLIPYYPFLIGSGGYSNEHSTIILSRESYVDEEEREHMEWELRDALAEYKKCKRKKIPFDPDAYLNKIGEFWIRNYTEEIVRRVAKDGTKANLDGIHCEHRDKWYRAPLARLMKKYGYDDWYINTWVFGWRKTYPDWEKEEE